MSSPQDRQHSVKGPAIFELREPALELPEILLEESDGTLVPQRPAMATVFGSLYDKPAYVHRPERTLLKDWTQIFYQFGLEAAALKMIRD